MLKQAILRWSIACSMAAAACAGTPDSAALSKGFAAPPAQAKPWVYWYFMDGNLDHDGMFADLRAMKDAGIGGAIFFEVDIGVPRGPVGFMTPKWLDLVGGSLREADRLGIQVALASGPGWCGTGGPWVTPDLSMQDLVTSETNISGPGRVSAVLPRPQPITPYFGDRTLTPALRDLWKNYYRDVAVLAFPAPDGTNRIADIKEKALYRRDAFSSMRGVKPFLPAPVTYPSMPAGDCVALNRVIDLTGKMSPAGRLMWDVPPGQWTVMRLGRTITGQTTRPAPEPGLGFETDKFNRKALDAHFAAYVERVLSHAGPRTNAFGGASLLHFDSWEMGAQNWSPKFRQEFRKRRGYDPLKYLPAYAGLIVDSAEVSERFLWDIRQTAQELMVDNHVGHLRDLAHQHGLGLSVEPYDLNPCGDLSLGRVADVPQCEFWHLGFNTAYSAFEAASIGHTCARPVVAAEAFTSEPGEDWKADPASLKEQGDWAFCTGVNRFIFHRFQAQPWTNRWPGMTMAAYGVHWDRTQTWWDMAPAYHQYLARCQYLLQRGVTVADVCFLVAEGAPHVFRPPASAITTGTLPDHLGYNFDGCAPETLLERARVDHGKLAFPGGSTYPILVLPEQQTMTPKLLRKIKSLVRAGATVFGPPPMKSPGLENYPRCDAEVARLARELWGDCDGESVFTRKFGKGRVIWRKTNVKPGDQYGDFAAVTNLLNQSGLTPDFQSDARIRFTHRRDGGADIYFVANPKSAAVDATCVFRTAGRQPELFDPMTGAIRPLPQFTARDGLTSIPMKFEPLQSFFVVFRSPGAPAGDEGENFPAVQTVRELSGAWNVSFDPRWGGPESVVFDSLTDWTNRPEHGIKYYSGKAVYRKTFVLAHEVDLGQKVFVDLGAVKNLARVRLNGRALGVAWCAPWRVEATGALRSGTNDVEIEVANLWPNRLIADASLPEPQRLTWTTHNPYTEKSPLLPSGLLGPVTLKATQPRKFGPLGLGR